MPLRLTKASTLIRSFSCERFGCYLVGLSVPHLKELLAVYAPRRPLATPNIEKSARAADYYAGDALDAAFASPNIEKFANEVNFMQNGNGSARPLPKFAFMCTQCGQMMSANRYYAQKACSRSRNSCEHAAARNPERTSSVDCAHNRNFWQDLAFCALINKPTAAKPCSPLRNPMKRRWRRNRCHAEDA